MDKMRMESVDMTAQNIDKIEKLFPNCITEMIDEEKSTPEEPVYKKAVNFELLKQMLSGEVVEGREAYEFTWVGKKASIVEANKPIRKTLRPCKEESVNWDNTENLYIEGDNLEVLKLLQESYLGKVKMIYIDPPYNTGNDFIYNDDFKVSAEEYAEDSGQIDEDGNRLFKNTDSNGRFHSDWCSMMYSRLLVARNLLSDDGVIFISIDDNEQENLKKICDEVFGERNFVSQIVWQNKEGGGKSDSKFFRQKHEYIFVYAKKIELLTIKPIPVTDEDRYKFEDEYVETRGKYQLIKLDSGSLGWVKSLDYPIELNGQTFYAGGDKKKWEDRQNGGNAIKDWGWRWSKEKLKWGIENGFVVTKKNKKGEWNIYTKQYFNCDKDGNIIDGRKIQPLAVIDDFSTTQANKQLKELFGTAIFNYSKPKELLMYLVNLVTNNNDLILDFFSGSGTTAHAIFLQNVLDNSNRNFILVQLQEDFGNETYKNICEIGKERIRRAGKMIIEDNKDKEGIENFDNGFRVLKLADSNMKDVYYNPNIISQDLLSSLESNVKGYRTDLDLLFGCLLEWGLPLSLPYSTEVINGFTIHNYNDGDLIACFDEDIPEDVFKEIAKLQPLRAVFRDSSFVDSPSKINVSEIFKLLAPDTRIKVI